jgi:hypothetical protein
LGEALSRLVNDVARFALSAATEVDVGRQVSCLAASDGCRLPQRPRPEFPGRRADCSSPAGCGLSAAGSSVRSCPGSSDDMEPHAHKVQVVGVRPFRRGRRGWVRLSDSGLGRWRTPGPVEPAASTAVSSVAVTFLGPHRGALLPGEDAAGESSRSVEGGNVPKPMTLG